MTEIERLFLSVLEAGLHSRGVELSGEISSEAAFDEIMSLAARHKLLPLVFDVLGTVSDCSHLESFAHVRRAALRQVAQQSVQSEELLALCDEFSKVGLHPIVVKGIVCRSLYPNGELRPSADEDILVSPSELDACRALLEAHGFATRDDAGFFEQTYTREADTLRIELHCALFPPSSSAYGELNRFFSDAHERAEKIKLGSHTVCTLEPTQHMLYLILHAYKHFIHSGFGIRQLCDIVAFAEKCGEKTDFAAVASACREISADTFAAALFTLAEDCLGLDRSTAEHILTLFGGRVGYDSLLCDILASGIYGSADESRVHSGNITLDALESEKNGKKSRRRHMRLSALFPPLERIRGRYPYLKRRPYLAPVAYISRALSYLAKPSRPTKSVDLGARRVELLREYRIIDREEQG